MRGKMRSLLLIMLVVALSVMGCNGSQSDTPASSASTVAATTEGTDTTATDTADDTSSAEAYTDEDVQNMLAVLSGALLEVPWQEIDWNAYEDQLSETSTVASGAATTPSLTVVNKEGLTVTVSYVNDTLTKPAFLFTYSFNGYKLEDQGLVTERSLTGTLYVRVYWDSLSKLQLGLYLYTLEAPLALSGKVIFIPSTTTIGVPKFSLSYSLWTLKFLDDPAPSGTIVINKALPITLNAEWMSFFLKIING